MPLRQWILGAYFFLAGCDGTSATEAIVEVSSETPIASVTSLLNVRIYQGLSGDAVPNELTDEYSLSAPTFPTTITTEPTSGDSGRFRVVVSAVDASGAAVAQANVIGDFRRGRTVRAALLLEAACRGVFCEVSQTCRGGVCVDASTGDPTLPGEGSCGIGFAAAPDCSVGCPAGLRHVSSGFVPATREGLWLCGDVASSGELRATTASGDTQLRGYVPSGGHDGTPLVGTDADGTTYRVRAR